MNSPAVIDFGANDTYPVRQLTESWEHDQTKFYNAAAALGIPVFQLVEFLTKPEERAMNDLTTAALMMWYMSGVDIESDNGFSANNKLVQIGDMTQDEFDMTPQGKMFWEIVSQDWCNSIAYGSPTNPDMWRDEMDRHNPAVLLQSLTRNPDPLENIYNPTPPDDANQSNILAQLAAGEPWNEYQELMWMMKDDWGPSIDWMQVVGGVSTTNKEEVEKKYRDMSFNEALMLRTGETVQHMITEVGFSKAKVMMQAHGIQFRASYDYINNPSVSARDFRWEAERVGVAMKIVLFLQVLDFIIKEAAYQPKIDPFGNLETLTSERWLNFSKMPMSKPFNLFFSTPQMITKWQLAMLGFMGADNQMTGVTQLMNIMRRAKDSMQLNNGSRLPRYGWIDNIHSQELYNKFDDSDESGLNNSGGEKQALLCNRGSSSEIIFKRTSDQDESGRNTRERYVYRDLHTKWGIHRPEDPLESGAGTHRGKSNIIRTAIS